MKYLFSSALISLIMLCGGCREPEPLPTPTPEPEPTELETLQRPSTRNFRIRFSVSSSEDVYVKEGDVVTAGTILASQKEKLNQLERQKKRLEELLDTMIKPMPAFPIPSLPPVSYKGEEAVIQKNRIKVDEINSLLTQQQKRLSQVSDMPEIVREHETARLRDLERQLMLAELDLSLAENNLEKAKERRAELEYRHEIRVQEEEFNRERDERTRQNAQAQLLYQLGIVEANLNQVTVIKAPWNGTIQRIRWLEQRNNDLSVELTMSVSSDVRISAPMPGGNPSVRTDSDPDSNGEEPETEEPQLPPFFGL